MKLERIQTPESSGMYGSLEKSDSAPLPGQRVESTDDAGGQKRQNSQLPPRRPRVTAEEAPPDESAPVVTKTPGQGGLLDITA